MIPGWAVLGNGLNMLVSGVALVSDPPKLWILLVERLHQSVTRHLRYNGCGSNRPAPIITANDGAGRAR